MDAKIKNLLSLDENQYILVNGELALLEALQLVKKEKGNPNWFLLVEMGDDKYLFTKINKLNPLTRGESRDVLKTPLKDFGTHFKEITSIEYPSNYEDLETHFITSRAPASVITLMGVVVGLITQESLGKPLVEALKKKQEHQIEKDKPRIRDGSSPRNKTFKKISNFYDKTSKWVQENRLASILGFIILTLFPTVWLFANEVIPTINPDKQMMSGEWNIAVAGFTPQGKEKVSREEAYLIGSVFFNRLQSELTDITETTDIIVDVWGPEEVGFIKGDSQIKREFNAEKLANEINADIVIFGTITREGNTIILQPEFFVSILNYYEAEEMVGQHSLGDKILINNVNDRVTSQVTLNRELSRRSQVLTLITKGLSLYFIHAYEDALGLFQEANRDYYWQSISGREVLYLFEGNAAGKALMLDVAEEAYLEAITMEPEYARGYAGLASIYYLNALAQTNNQPYAPNIKLLDNSLDLFHQAMGVSIRPESADIPTKVSFGLGQIYLAKWFTGEDTLSLAIENFYSVISFYNDGENPRIKEFASETYARLGLIERQLNHIEDSITLYEEALSLASNPGRRGLYWATLADLYSSQGNDELSRTSNKKSIEEYEIALSLTTNHSLSAIYYAAISERYKRLGNIPKAIETINLAIRELPDDDELLGTYQSRLQELSNLEP